MTRTDPKPDSSSKYVGHPSRLYHVRIIIQSGILLHLFIFKNFLNLKNFQPEISFYHFSWYDERLERL